MAIRFVAVSTLKSGISDLVECCEMRGLSSSLGRDVFRLCLKRWLLGNKLLSSLNN